MQLKKFTAESLTKEIRAYVFALRDPRLPIAVRFCFLIALAYFICPYDFRTDFAAGGYIDDSIIVPILIAGAIFLIPATIVSDSRKLASSATALGFTWMFITVAQNSAPLPLSVEHCKTATLRDKVASTTPDLFVRHSSIKVAKESASVKLNGLCYNKPQLISESKTVGPAPPNQLTQPKCSAYANWSRADKQSLIPMKPRSKGMAGLPFSFPSRALHHFITFLSQESATIVCIMRGGQLQIYGDSDDSSAHFCALEQCILSIKRAASVACRRLSFLSKTGAPLLIGEKENSFS